MHLYVCLLQVIDAHLETLAVAVQPKLILSSQVARKRDDGVDDKSLRGWLHENVSLEFLATLESLFTVTEHYKQRSILLTDCVCQQDHQ